MIMRVPLFEQPWSGDEFRFFQLGHVVDDVLTAAADWARTFGVGPFHVLPVAEQGFNHDGAVHTIRLQVAVAQAGPVQIELIQQHCDTPSIYSEWSRGGTSAFHQLATVTSDYDAKTAHFAALGYRIAAQSTGGGFRVGYVDTVADFGFYTEVVEAPPAFLTQVSAIAETCARWDGRDPVRIMTRDGYRVPAL
ncbi:methylmalonyl-CoA epimerase [Novosphingobium sp. PP1Y] [Mycolicibacterium parafortuitum]|uniref:Methylmalonyl-CoA epimerase [Novosphingobium sp. PP1Y] n=2 Tax=Mycolicibacterium parafortuitum TaxID=39692 RepID=A0A375YNT3_MYCPF|nr:glyoxalase [Mycolicibacterium parafortuitum]SRX82796.1 methylmalonyl-CoA epimerase [Novosphingobium sp. PP1Y] [Mycolicibacterium parafortuitum]